MKYMILVKASQDTEAGKLPPESLIAEMGAYHEELAKAGVLVDGAGLKPSKRGWRIKYGKNGKRTFVDGPFAESKELVAGYTIIDVKSREEAIAWTKRYPNPSSDAGEAEIEVREYYELEDLGDSPELERFRNIGIGE
jgi:hypothetical protein